MLGGVVSDTPTEPASPRALARARARGDLPYAAELPLGLLLLALLGLSAAPLTSLLGAWRRFARELWRGQLSSSQVWQPLYELSAWLALVLAAPVLAALAALVAQRAATLRWFVAAPEHRPAERPRAWGRRPLRAVVAAVKAFALIIGLAAVVYDSWPGLLGAYERDAAELLELVLRVLGALALRAALILLVLAGCELGVQQLVRLRRLRMTRQQVQDEQRELSGDPRMLAERRARSASPLGASERMSAQLRAASIARLGGASLLITGSARVVALRYAPDQLAVPVVWLRAEGAHALEIVQRAYSLRLPIVSDEPLADVLARLEPPAPIPQAWHTRVASLLVVSGAYVVTEAS